MELRRDPLGWMVVLTPRNVDELMRGLALLEAKKEHGVCGILRKLNDTGDEFLTVAVDLDGEKSEFLTVPVNIYDV
jgi:hypothetical protein